MIDTDQYKKNNLKIKNKTTGNQNTMKVDETRAWKLKDLIN